MTSAIRVTFDDPDEYSWFADFAADMPSRPRDAEHRFATALEVDATAAGRAAAATWSGTSESRTAGLGDLCEDDSLNEEHLARFAAFETAALAARRRDWDTATSTAPQVTYSSFNLQ